MIFHSWPLSPAEKAGKKEERRRSQAEGTGALFSCFGQVWLLREGQVCRVTFSPVAVRAVRVRLEEPEGEAQPPHDIRCFLVAEASSLHATPGRCADFLKTYLHC